MKLRYLLAAAIFLTSLFALSFRVTHSYFSNTGQSTSNVFTASAQFPTPTPTSTPTPTPTPIPTPVPGDVVINEINWGGNNLATGSADEWIELRNLTDHVIDIGNWVVEHLAIAGGNVVIPTGKSIGANGFFLISNFDKDTSRVNVDPDFVTTAVSLTDDGKQLLLRTATIGGILLDTANTATPPGHWFFGSKDDPTQSMERKSLPGDGTLSTNWQSATTHTGMDGLTSTDEFGTPKNPNGL